MYLEAVVSRGFQQFHQASFSKAWLCVAALGVIHMCCQLCWKAFWNFLRCPKRRILFCARVIKQRRFRRAKSRVLPAVACLPGQAKHESVIGLRADGTCWAMIPPCQRGPWKSCNTDCAQLNAIGHFFEDPVLRGGVRKQTDERQLLAGLKAFLESFDKPPHHKAEHPHQSHEPKAVPKKKNGRVSLLVALKKLVQRCEENPASLLQQLQRLIKAADEGQVLVAGPPSVKAENPAKPAVRADESNQAGWTKVTRSKKTKGEKSAKAVQAPSQPFHLWKDPAKPNDVGSFSAVCAELQKGSAPSAKVVEVNAAQAEEIKVLVASHDIQNCGLTLAFVNSAAPSEATKRWLHVANANSPPTVKLIPCLTVGQGTTLPSQVKVTKAEAPVLAETAVLRITCDKQYVSEVEWKKIVDKPANAFHCMTEAKGLSKQIVSSYGWRLLTAAKCDDQITGFLKVNAEAKGQFLQISGADGFFIDTLAKHGPKSHVDWVAPSVQENRIEYRVRLLKESDGQGLALRQGKGTALGLRVSARPESLSPKPANWQLDGVPRNWSVQNLCDFLTKQSWSDVSPISKPQGSRGWVVRATAPDTALCHVFELGNETIVVHLASARSPRRHQKPINRAGCDIRPVPTKWSKASGVAVPTPVQQAVEVMEVDSQNDKKETAAGKRPDSNSQGLSPPKKVSKSEPDSSNAKTEGAGSTSQPFGFQLLDAGGSGDCGYRAAAVAYAVATGRDIAESKSNAKALGATLRAQVASHLKKHQHYKETWLPDSRWTPTTEGGPVPRSYDEWLGAVARPNRWVCGPTLVGIATRLRRNLVIFKYIDDAWVKVSFVTPFESSKKEFQDAAKFPPLPLLLKDKHYTTLEPSPIGWPAHWNSAATEAKWDANEARGGVKSVRSFASWLPASSSAPSKKAVCKSKQGKPASRNQTSKSFRSWLPASSSASRTLQSTKVSKFAQCSTSNLSDFEDVDNCAKSAAQATSSSSGGLKAKSWTCSSCGFCTGVTRFWSQRKCHHIKAWHPEERANFNLVKSKVFVEWTPDCVWKCPHCNLGIPPHVPAKARSDARLQHGRNKHPDVDQKDFHAAPDPERVRANSKKATLAKIAAGVAKRLLEFKAGKQGDHDTVFLELPYTGKTRSYRNSARFIYCKKCTALAESTAAIANIKCNVKSRSGASRARLVSRLQELCQDPDANPADVALAKHALPLLEIKKAADRRHVVQRFDWPLPDHKFVFICKLCSKSAFTRNSLQSSKIACTDRSRASLPLRVLDEALSKARVPAKAKLLAMQRLLSGDARDSQANHD